MRVGYVRVSAVDQNTARQLDGIAVDKTFTDKMSGKDTDRDQLTAMLGYVREGDTVVVHSMDRLARNLGDLLTLVQDLTDAQLMLSIMGAVAQFERAMIGERQREGIAKAKARGVYTGRKPALSDAQAGELRARAAAGERKTALAQAFGISRDTVYTYLQAGVPTLPVDTRPLPNTAVYDQLLTRPRGAQARSPSGSTASGSPLPAEWCRAWPPRCPACGAAGPARSHWANSSASGPRPARAPSWHTRARWRPLFSCRRQARSKAVSWSCSKRVCCEQDCPGCGFATGWPRPGRARSSRGRSECCRCCWGIGSPAGRCGCGYPRPALRTDPRTAPQVSGRRYAVVAQSVSVGVSSARVK
ncbi:helix-turn-helix domain-containing protein [Nocardia sp. SYP-A9097]|nr:helix-turn-helix domain-containing protein [Nocardia sp. SYP-A9097]